MGKLSNLIGRPNVEIDKDEIDEIIELYITEMLNGVRSKLNYNGVNKFNEKIAKSLKYIRKNGEQFRVYSRTIWSGSYKGEDYYGRQKINEIRSSAKKEPMGEAFVPEVADISLIFENSKISRGKLKIRIIKLFERERKKYNDSQKDLERYKQQRDQWQEKYNSLLKAVTSLMYQSQLPDNSLNDMFHFDIGTNSLCREEFKGMFNNDETVVNILLNSNHKQGITADNIVELNPKLNKPEYEGL